MVHFRFGRIRWPDTCESAFRELKQTDTAAANLQFSIHKDSRPSEFSRPLTSITLNGDLPVDRRPVSLLELFIILDSTTRALLMKTVTKNNRQ